MDEKIHVLSLQVDLVDHDHDHWCNTCMLATGIRATFAVAYAERMHLQVKLWCPLCDGHNITPTDEPRHC